MTLPIHPASPPPYDSQHQLALSIARAVQLGLPAPDSEEAIAASVEESLRAEARHNTELLAFIQVCALAIVALLAVIAYAFPLWLRLASFPSWTVAAALVSLALSSAFLLSLRKGWYRPWLRIVLPVLDGLIIGVGGAVFLRTLNSPGANEVTGFLAIIATSCAFVAFSGGLRLSRTAAVISPTVGVLAWLGVATQARLGVVPIVIIAATILTTGLLGTRITRIIRRVITTETQRVRLTTLYKDAQKAIQAREEVLKIVSHDLRNPLGTIAMAADFLLEEPSTEAIRTRQLSIIKRSGQRMNRLIQDLLDAARIEAGTLPIERQRVGIVDLIDGVMEMMLPHAEEKELMLERSIPDESPDLWIDKERICQVFSNLVGNAIKFTPEGGRITIAATRVGAKVKMSVIDTGPGIPAEQVPKIFRRMWQAEKGDTRGIGLGLTIAKAIVEAHGEQIDVRSRVGEGTEFWFTVPVAPETVGAPAGLV